MKKALFVLIALTVLYFVWHLGRWYEFRAISATLQEALTMSVDAMYVIPTDNEQYANEWAYGRCFSAPGEAMMFKYMGVDE